ncbi:hypothetical protein FZEAL_5132 [Fusarium zealandicum]|uniref:D-isomer specific 2-hydroxyacid dehydrogenase NAD-binding domain-containing protein n=1 Tax=Fusarium zealandicum TaxID=1053134 RepID=A0A8H4UKZ5_9HYPO|nr:hypothetical protein FZEAL_5132 [Fusarium zealandicum]
MEFNFFTRRSRPNREPTRQTNQVRPCPGNLSPQARLTMFEEMAKPAIVEFIPGMTLEARTARLRTEMITRGRPVMRKAFERTHHLLFKDCEFKWSRMDPAKDVFLTAEMMLPTPKLLGVHGQMWPTLVSIPIQKLSSTFRGWLDVSSAEFGDMSGIPLNLCLLPHLREFTMVCLGPVGGNSLLAKRSQTLNPASFGRGQSWRWWIEFWDDSKITQRNETMALLGFQTCPVRCSHGNAVTDDRWYGFRYFVESRRVEFTRLEWHEVYKMTLIGENSREEVPDMVARLWIVRRGEESRLKREPHHAWKEASGLDNRVRFPTKQLEVYLDTLLQRLYHLDKMTLKDDVLLVYLPTPAPQSFLDAVHAKHPELEVRWYEAPVANFQLMGLENLPAGAWDGVTLVCTYHIPDIELVPNVRFFQSASAGLDMWADYPKYLDPDVLVCNSGGCQPPQIAEWVIGTYLSHEHRFQVYAEQQKEELWRPRIELGMQVSTGRRMGILGYGGIGRQCARLGQALGMEVYAYTLRDRPTPESRRDDMYCIPGTGDPDGLIPTKWFSGGSKDDIDNFLGQDLDLLVISLPLTDNTRQLLSTEQFQILSKNRNKTFVSNVARGPIIDTDALVYALENGLVRGSAADVTDPEPLPKGHPLWKAPNFFLTPHISWLSSRYWVNFSGLLLENLERLATGRPVLNRDNGKSK